MQSTFTDPHRQKKTTIKESHEEDKRNDLCRNDQEGEKIKRHQRRTASTLISENLDETSRSDANDMFNDNYDDAVTPEKNLIAESEQAGYFPPQFSRNKNSKPQLERRPIDDQQQIRELPLQNSKQPQSNSQIQPLSSDESFSKQQAQGVHHKKPSPEGQLVQCNVKTESTFSGFFYPKYHLYTADNIYLMSAQSQSIREKKYTFYYDKSCTKSYLIGKVEQGKTNNEYILLSQSLKGSVNYDQDKVRPSGPKVMNVQLEMEESKDFKKTLTCVNRKSTWCPQTQIHQMKFTNRINMPSMHNFQIYEESQKDINLVQFGLLNNEYTLDFQWPLSPLQAFQIAVSSLASE